MRIAVVTGGSRGDVQPAAVLAKKLASRGHEIRFWAQESFRSMAESMELPFHPIGGAPPEKVMAELETHKPRTAFGKLSAILRGGRPELHRLVDMEEASSDVDGVVFGTMSSFGRHAAEGKRVPYVITHVSPLYRTRYYPHPNLPFRAGQSRSRNYLTHLGFDQLFWAADRRWVNDWRRQRLGLPALPLHAWRIPEREHPVLFGYSPAVLPTPADWPANCEVTGYWLPEESLDPEPPPGVEEFLQRPALAIGFGSSIPPRPDFWPTIVQELRRAGLRAVIVKGWSGQEEVADDHIFQVSSIDYRWLFSRVTAVVHTGGSGVSSMALRAGVPSLTIPFGGDQRFWAWRLAELGVGVRPLPFAAFGAEELRERFRDLLENDGLARKGRELAAVIAKEDGLTTAAQKIEDHFQKR